MKTYTIQIGEIFTQEKAQELKEYLEAKDNEILLFYEEIIRNMDNYLCLQKPEGIIR